MARAEVHKLMERMAIPAIAAPMFLVSNPALTLGDDAANPARQTPRASRPIEPPPRRWRRSIGTRAPRPARLRWRSRTRRADSVT